MKATLTEKLRYRFDSFMAKGGRSSFVALTAVFFVSLGVITITRALFTEGVGDVDVERGHGFWRQAWITFLEITDPGSMSQDVDSSPFVKIFTVLAGMVGIVLFSALIALVTNALDQRLQNMRKGHSKVIEDEHSLILGWNDRIVDILRELTLANESEPSATVVILADRDKEEMDDFIALNLPDTLTTKIVTRSGSSSASVNLGVVSAETARSVIVLAQAAVGDDEADLKRSDLSVIKTVLAVRQVLGAKEVPVVAELFGAQRRDLARSIDPNNVVCIDADALLAKILVQTSRSEALAVVYEEILSFDGSEMYFFEESWGGATFRDASFRMPDGVPMGVLSEGKLYINPDPERRLLDGDELLVLATDDSTLELRDAPVAQHKTFVLPGLERARSTERNLIIGWTNKLPTIVSEYDDYVESGSTIDIVLRDDNLPADALVAALTEGSENLEVNIRNCDPFDATALSKLEPGRYDNILILSEAGAAGGAEWADAETLLILMQLQRLVKNEPKQPTLIAEILDSKNRTLVTQTGVSEFIISNRLVSMLAAQLSEDARLFMVYEDLFSADGAEVYLKPMSYYFSDFPRELTFADLMSAASARGEIALGFRQTARSTPETNFGVRLIPPKPEVQTFTAEDFIVVLAEDDR